MAKTQIQKLRKKMKKELDKNRYEHTLGVSYTCAALAMRYGYSIQKAQIAGMLHDCAKGKSTDKILEMCERNNVPISVAERKSPYLLHAKLGAFLAMNKYQIHSIEIINAILCHTTGKEEMTLLDKIVFVADYIEPLRSRQENLREVRQMAFIDLDEAVYMILRDTLRYLKKYSQEIDDTTEKAYHYYKKIHKMKETKKHENIKGNVENCL